MNPEYIIYAVAAVAFMAGLLFLAAHLAPDGYEDEAGFHYSEKDDT